MPTLVLPRTVSDPSVGQPIIAAWGDAVNDAVDFLASPPACHLYNSAAISIPHNASTTLTFNSEHDDDLAMHSTSTNPSRITVPHAGRYLVRLGFYFASNATGWREAHIRVNGSIYARDGKQAVNGGVTGFSLSLVTRRLSVGQYLEASVFQNSGAALDASFDADESPEFSAVWLGL